MKHKAITGPVINASMDSSKIVEITDDFVSGQHPGRSKKRVAGLAVTSVVAVGLGIVAARAVSKSRRVERDRQEAEAKLDKSLEAAGNTSEPTAMY